MSELTSGLRDGKIGRVPIWAVGVGLAGAIVLFMFWRNRSASSAASSSVATDDQSLYYSGEEGVEGLPPGAIGDFLGSNPTDPAYPVGLTPGGIPGPITNVQWSRLAFDWLIGLGNDPSLTERALAKYIQGMSLTAQETSIVNLAKTAFGAPPEGLILTPPETPVPPPTTQPAPGPGPTPTPALGVVWENVLKGQSSDAWINAMTAKYGVYYGTIAASNPGIVGNISLNPIPSKRVFLYSTAYRIDGRKR